MKPETSAIVAQGVIKDVRGQIVVVEGGALPVGATIPVYLTNRERAAIMSIWPHATTIAPDSVGGFTRPWPPVFMRVNAVADTLSGAMLMPNMYHRFPIYLEVANNSNPNFVHFMGPTSTSIFVNWHILPT